MLPVEQNKWNNCSPLYSHVSDHYNNTDSSCCDINTLTFSLPHLHPLCPFIPIDPALCHHLWLQAAVWLTCPLFTSVRAGLYSSHNSRCQGDRWVSSVETLHLHLCHLRLVWAGLSESQSHQCDKQQCHWLTANTTSFFVSFQTTAEIWSRSKGRSHADVSDCSVSCKSRACLDLSVVQSQRSRLLRSRGSFSSQYSTVCYQRSRGSQSVVVQTVGLKYKGGHIHSYSEISTVLLFILLHC